MKALSNEVTCLLDKLYNFRGEDSVILAKLEEESKIAKNTWEETSNQKQNLENIINGLNSDEDLLSTEGEKLVEILNLVDNIDYKFVTDYLKIDFDPQAVLDILNEKLPASLDTISTNKESAIKELSTVEEHLSDTLMKIEELDFKKEGARHDQEQLNKYFDFAFDSNSNITRDELVSLLSRFDLTDDEKREAAKILMFPEDELFEYENNYKNRDSGKSIIDVIHEAKEVKECIVEEPKEESEPVLTDSKEESIPFALEAINGDDKVLDEHDEINFENLLNIDNSETLDEGDKLISDDFSKLFEKLNLYVDEKIETTDEEKTDEKVADTNDVDKDNKENVTEDIETKNEADACLECLGLNPKSFTGSELELIKDKYDSELFKKNVEYVDSIGMNKDMFVDNVCLLYDNELVAKIDKLISVGKDLNDIYLNPDVLIKYDLKELNDAISVLNESGLDPKLVPLIAY